MAAKIGPKIALNFDTNHNDIVEKLISCRLCGIDFRKKIVYLRECRTLETESLNQYSLELLYQDDPLSSSTACNLLAESIIWEVHPNRLAPILWTIYCEPDMKKFFMGKSYFKFNPYEHGLNFRNFRCDELDENNVTSSQKNIIKIIEQLFLHLDRTLPNLEDGQREKHIVKLSDETANLVLEKNNFSSDYPFFAKIWQAIAFMKIKQVFAKLGPDSDKSKELSLDMINRLYQGPKCEMKFFEELNLNFRTRFQVQKVIKLVEKILSAKNSDPNTIFLVRDGIGHRELLISHLTQHFKKGEIKEIVLTIDDVSPEMEEKIREKFAAAPNLLPKPIDAVVGNKSGNYETTHPLLQGLPVFHLPEKD